MDVIGTQWWAIVVFSFVMTLAWLFVDKRVTTTALLAGAGWSFAVLTGGKLTYTTEAGIRYYNNVGEIRYFALFMALLSFMVLILYRFGHYPPEEDDPMKGGTYER